jgi:hypothetical protein
MDGVLIDGPIYWTLTETRLGLTIGLTELHIPKATVTSGHLKSSQTSLVVAW